MKYATLIGIAAGFAIALSIMIGGLSGFLLTVLLCLIGGIVGAHLEGLIDLRAVINRNGRGRG